jgi:hypothetical protein
MATGISPQVEVNEIDLSIIAQEAFGHPYLILGEATRGRDDKPILVTNKANYVNLFGALDTNMPSTYAAMEYLSWGNQLWYKRVTSTKMVKVLSSTVVTFSPKSLGTMTLTGASSPYLLGTTAQTPIALFLIDPLGTISPFKVYVTSCNGSHIYNVIWDSYGVDWSDPTSVIVPDAGAALTLDVYVSHAEPAFNSNVFFFQGDATTAPSYGTADLMFNNELTRQDLNSTVTLNNTDYYVSSYANTSDFGPTQLPSVVISATAGAVATGFYAYRYSLVNGTTESAMSLPVYAEMVGGPISFDITFPSLPTGWTGYNLYKCFFGTTFGATAPTTYEKCNTSTITSNSYNDGVVSSAVNYVAAIPTCPVSVSLNGTAMLLTGDYDSRRYVQLDSDGKTVLGDYTYDVFVKTKTDPAVVIPVAINGVTTASTATANVLVNSAGHGLITGDAVLIYGATDTTINGKVFLVDRTTAPAGVGAFYLQGTKGYYHPGGGALGFCKKINTADIGATWVIGTSPEPAVGDTLKIVTPVNHDKLLDNGAYTVDTTDFSKTGQYLLSDFVQLMQTSSTARTITVWAAPNATTNGLVTAVGHGFQTGDIVYIENAMNATSGADLNVSNQHWRIIKASANTFYLSGTEGMQTFLGAAAASASGTVRKIASASTSLYRFTGNGSYTIPAYSTINAYQSTLENNYYYYPESAFYRYAATSKGRGTWANGTKVYAAYNSTTEEFECLIYDINNTLQERWSDSDLATVVSNINEYSNYINLIDLPDSSASTIVNFFTGISGTTSFAQYTQAQLTGGNDGYFDVDEADFIANIDTGVAGSKYSLDNDYSDLLASSQMIEEFDGTIDYELMFACGWSANPTLAGKMSEVCASRKFSACAVDLPSGLNPNAAVQFRNTSFSSVNSSYAAMYWNYVKVYDAANDVFVWLPPTVFAIRSLAYTDSVAQPWFAAAGLRRGLVPEALELEFYPTLGDRDALYAVQINPIARIGTTIAIWGNRTSQKIRSMLSNFSARRLLVSAEKAVYLTSQAYLFEPNDKVERQRLLITLQPTFDLIRQQRGLDEFGLFDSTTDLQAAENTASFRIELKITPVMEKIVHNFIVKGPLQEIGS